MKATTSDLSDTHREENVRNFFRYLHDFSNGGWYGGEYRQEGSSNPHLLRAEYHHKDLYFSALFSMSHQLLENAYKDKYQEKNPASQWSQLFPEVEQIISAHGAEVEQAFHTLFETCKTYHKSVEDMPSGYQGKTITREEHGITQEQADKLHDALQKIWHAYPQTDTRISEGFDYVMSDSVVRKTFTFASPIGNVSAYSFEESSSKDRSDYRLAEMLESYDGKKVKRLDSWKNEEDMPPEQLAAIAAQSMINLEKMQAFSAQIGERSMECLIKTVCKDPSRANAVAKEIVEKLSSGKTAFKEEAEKIRNGAYGKLAGSCKMWLNPDDERKRALAIVSGAEDYLKFCMDVYSGTWFEQQRDKIAALSVQKALTGFERGKGEARIQEAASQRLERLKSRRPPKSPFRRNQP